MEAGTLISEMKRRRVIRALVGYGIAAFAVLQIIEPVMHGLHWPDEVLSYVVVALAVGFPIVVSLAWIFDVNAGRVERTTATAEGPKGARLALLLIGIGVLAAAPGTIWYFVWPGYARSQGASTPASTTLPPSIAVLPFADMSAQKDQEYFSDGVAEEIINALAQVEGLRVIGRTSSFYFKGKNVRLGDIGRELGVAHLLEGSVRRAGGRVRVTAQLIAAQDGFHLWSQTYDRELTDIFAVQDEIARAVVAALKIKLLPGTMTAALGPLSPEAYEQYLLALRMFNGQEYVKAIEAYDKAIAQAPTFVPAHVGIAFAAMYAEELSDATPELAADRRRRAIEAAEQAVQLAPELADARLARGLVRMAFQYEWKSGRADVERAIELNPGNANTHRLYGFFRASLDGPAAALANVRKAVELEPLSHIAWASLGYILLCSGQYSEARSALQRSEAIEPKQVWVYKNLGQILLFEGKPADALTTFGRSISEMIRLIGAAMALHDLGREDDSQHALDTLIARFGGSSAYRVAEVYAWRGEADLAFEWLDTALTRRNYRLAAQVKIDPLLRKLHGDPRWPALLRKMNMPPD